MQTDGGLVTSQDPRSADAGAQILAAGGNAVDAAVAAALAIGVVEPCMSGLGGSTWITIRRSPGGRTMVVDGAGRTPARARPDMFQLDKTADPAGPYGWPKVVDDANIHGARSTYVPGAVSALCMAHETLGRLPRRRVFEPAIALAADGVEVNGFMSALITQDADVLRRDPGCAEVLLPDGLPLRPAGLGPADILRQPALADTLERIAEDGARAFYSGRVAASIAATVADGGGLLDKADLASYQATLAEPLELDAVGLRVAVPPMTGGPSVLQGLRLFEALQRRSPEAAPALVWALALRLAFRDRFDHMSGDPAIDVPWEFLLSREHAAELLSEIHPAGRIDAPARSGCTSHLNVVDADGMAVALTTTLLHPFGARVLDPNSGVLLNDGMMWFDPRPGRPNSIRGGVPGLTAASPALLTREGELLGAVGATGGRGIISAVAQIIEGIGVGLDAQSAVDRPRVHNEGTVVTVDARTDRDEITALEAAGEPVTLVEDTSLTWNFARPNAITVGVDGRRNAGLDRIHPAGAAAA